MERPTGYLWLGNSETIGPSTEHFTVVDRKHKIYLKKASYPRPGLEVPAKMPEAMSLRDKDRARSRQKYRESNS